MSRNWREVVDQMTDVQKLVHLAVRMDQQHEEAYRSELLKSRRREYEAALTDLANAVGCDREGRLQEGSILTELNNASKIDAGSIVNTYNYDLAHAIIQISNDVPTANRNTYAKRLREWETSRGEWKNQQIALNTHLTTLGKAQREFLENNTNIDAEAILEGPDPAAEAICQGWLNRGRVPIQTAINNPSPFHLGCPHPWKILPLGQVEPGGCDDLWLG